MKLADVRSILNKELWPRLIPRPHALPLLLAGVPSYLAFAVIAFGLRSPNMVTALRHPALISLIRPPIVWVLAVVWIAVDVLLVHRATRCLRKADEPARPIRLFFLWQVTKLAFCLPFCALVYAYYLPY